MNPQITQISQRGLYPQPKEDLNTEVTEASRRPQRSLAAKASGRLLLQRRRNLKNAKALCLLVVQTPDKKAMED
jgi:hypothetical protein